VASDVTLARLHRVLQVAMGWENCHLHEFRAGDSRFGVPDPDCNDDVRDDRRATLAGIARAAGDTFLYLYDFGDGWEHEIVVEGVVTPDPTVQYPWCLTGERACPPEDCGGPPGFESFREAVEDPTHEDHGHMLSWVGGNYDAEAFDREKVNATLRQTR
jgi:hypothetical protein